MDTFVTTAAGLFGSRERLARDAQLRGNLAGESSASLGLHALLIALLLLSVRPRPLEPFTAPSPVAVVFEGGPKAATPQTEESRRSLPTAAPDPDATEQAPPGAPPRAIAAAPRQASRPAPQSAPLPVPVQPSPPGAAVSAPEVPAFVHGSAPAELAPATHATSHARAAPPPRPPRRPPAPASPFSALSQPMDLSLTGRPPPPASAGHLSRGINLAMAPNDQNRNVMTRYAEARRKLGEDWWAAFSAFVEAHKFYPLAAAEHGEDGQSVLHLVIARDGTVRSATIELSSGSPRLDMAWLSEFRGAKVPPFPPGTEDSEVSFPASMTYILERQ